MKLERVEKLNLAMSAGAVAIAFALASPVFATSVALGAILEAANFGALMRAARQYFAGEIRGAGRWIAVFVLRFAFLGVGIFIMIRSGADPIGLIIGLSIAMPAVAIDSWLHRPVAVDPASLPALDPDDETWDRHSVWKIDKYEPAPAAAASPAQGPAAGELAQKSEAAKPSPSE